MSTKNIEAVLKSAGREESNPEIEAAWEELIALRNAAKSEAKIDQTNICGAETYRTARGLWRKIAEES